MTNQFNQLPGGTQFLVKAWEDDVYTIRGTVHGRPVAIHAESPDAAHDALARLEVFYQREMAVPCKGGEA